MCCREYILDSNVIDDCLISSGNLICAMTPGNWFGCGAGKLVWYSSWLTWQVDVIILRFCGSNNFDRLWMFLVEIFVMDLLERNCALCFLERLWFLLLLNTFTIFIVSCR